MKSEPKGAFPYRPPSKEILREYEHIFQMKILCQIDFGNRFLIKDFLFFYNFIFSTDFDRMYFLHN